MMLLGVCPATPSNNYNCLITRHLLPKQQLLPDPLGNPSTVGTSCTQIRGSSFDLVPNPCRFTAQGPDRAPVRFLGHQARQNTQFLLSGSCSTGTCGSIISRTTAHNNPVMPGNDSRVMV